MTVPPRIPTERWAKYLEVLTRTVHRLSGAPLSPQVFDCYWSVLDQAEIADVAELLLGSLIPSPRLATRRRPATMESAQGVTLHLRNVFDITVRVVREEDSSSSIVAHILDLSPTTT